MINSVNVDLLNTINLSDNIAYLKSLPDNSIDSIVTDSPYGLGKEPDPVKLLQDWIDHGYYEVKGKGFMGKTWDAFVPQPILWKECFRVLKPGGHLLSFFGTRTYHWGTVAIALAGFEIRDKIDWFYLDDQLHADFVNSLSEEQKKMFAQILKTDSGMQSWIYGSGFPKTKTALKPANEPICVARKPGASTLLNIDECRIKYQNETDFKLATSERPEIYKHGEILSGSFQDRTERGNKEGRYPSNVMFDEECAELLDVETGVLNQSLRKQGSVRKKNPEGVYNTLGAFKAIPKESYNDFGGASRFFYIAKASPSERKNNPHPTVKPVKLMRQLVRLYTPKDGMCLDPHGGSGSTALGCEDWCNYILIDSDPFSINIAKKRLSKEDKLF